MKAILLLTLTTLIYSCSSAPKKKIKITSTPGKAEVSIFNPKSKTYEKIGETPFEVNVNDKKRSDVFNKEFISLRLAKKGYVLENFTYDISTKQKLDLHSDMKRIEAWNDADRELSSTIANKIAESIQYLNRLILAGSHDDALKTADYLINEYPKAHIFHDIKGSIFILKGNTAQGISAYEKSLQLNPDNVESKKILQTLKGQVN